VSQILNVGLPSPIDVQIVGRSPLNYSIAKQVAADVKDIPGAVDVNIHQVLDTPAINVNVDRDRAQELGLTQRDVANNMLLSLSGSGQTAPNYWLDPKNGVNYFVATQTPQHDVDSLEALSNTPINAVGAPGQLLQNVAVMSRGLSPQNITHYNVQPTFDVYVNISGRDLGGVTSDVQKVIAKYEKKLPRGTTMVLRGQSESMNSSFIGLGTGIVFAIILVYLLMVVNFQKLIDPLIIICALPGALGGILWMLYLTGTTFSVPSLMGTIMCIGVATANSILVITFANDRRQFGDNALEAAYAAGRTRLRPVLMTALAMVIGMFPMALGLGEGGEQNAPLGRAVIGGLLVATFTTLFFVPTVYSVLRRTQPLPEDTGEHDANSVALEPSAAAAHK
jgi:multidrug efflux pump subunit AcrB